MVTPSQEIVNQQNPGREPLPMKGSSESASKSNEKKRVDELLSEIDSAPSSSESFGRNKKIQEIGRLHSSQFRDSSFDSSIIYESMASSELSSEEQSKGISDQSSASVKSLSDENASRSRDIPDHSRDSESASLEANASKSSDISEHSSAGVRSLSDDNASKSRDIPDQSGASESTSLKVNASKSRRVPNAGDDASTHSVSAISEKKIRLTNFEKKPIPHATKEDSKHNTGSSLARSHLNETGTHLNANSADLPNYNTESIKTLSPSSEDIENLKSHKSAVQGELKPEQPETIQQPTTSTTEMLPIVNIPKKTAFRPRSTNPRSRETNSGRPSPLITLKILEDTEDGNKEPFDM